MVKFRSLFALSFIMLVTLSLGCNKDEYFAGGNDQGIEVSPNWNNLDASISELRISSLRGSNSDTYSVSFTDSIRRKSYSFKMAKVGENKYSVDIPLEDGHSSIRIPLKFTQISSTECIVESEKNGVTFQALVKCEYTPGKGYLYSISNKPKSVEGLRVYYESWWECVKRISMNEEVSIASGLLSVVYAATFPATITAASVICMRDESRIPIK